jgi:tetratricopeptide (TPR) repeat protein
MPRPREWTAVLLLSLVGPEFTAPPRAQPACASAPLPAADAHRAPVALLPAAPPMQAAPPTKAAPTAPRTSAVPPTPGAKRPVSRPSGLVRGAADAGGDPIGRLESAAAAAERSLRAGDLAVAETGYRAVAAAGWLLSAEALIADGQQDAAVKVLEGAHRLAPDDAEVVYALAAGYLRTRQTTVAAARDDGPPEAGRRDADRRTVDPSDAEHRDAERRTVDQRDAKRRGGDQGAAERRDGDQRTAAQPAGGVRDAAPREDGRGEEDPERAAAALFDRLVALRPGAETLVLIGRTWRDARAFERARGALRTAIAVDPRVRRAHYYLGMVTVMDEGAARLDDAIAEFREELRIAPADPNANLALGMALVETRRAAEALPPLRTAARSPTAPANTFLYLGRCQASLGHPVDAVTSFRRALTLARAEAAHGTGSDEARLGAIHYQLATALRAMGKSAEAATEFAEAERVLALRASNTRERLTRYLAEIPDQPLPPSLAAPPTAANANSSSERPASPASPSAAPPPPSAASAIGGTSGGRVSPGAASAAASSTASAPSTTANASSSERPASAALPPDATPPSPAEARAVSPFAGLTAAQRRARLARVRAVVARACFNLGIMQAQANRFPVAADWFEQATLADPGFPQLAFSLGVARFNARQYDQATEPLARALAAEPSNATARRMLALARFNTDAFGAAVDLLRDDPQRDTDPSLQYIYGLALVRSDRAAEAEATFSRLLESHRDSAELTVVLGMAYAQQGDHDNAIATLRRALAMKPDVADANATLGLLYLKQGKLPDAAAALRAELQSHPDDVRARHTLATVLDLDGQSDEAIALLRGVLTARPDHADARYLLGKILLAQGHAPEAVEQLEAAVRLAPDEANTHYQLAQAYTKLGKTTEAEREFEAFRQLKDQRRERTP